MRNAEPSPEPLAKRKTMARRRAGGGAAPAAAGGGEGLSPPQRAALERMAAGETAKAAAAAAGVSRQTVHRWLREDPAFAAAFNAWQAEAVETARARLLALADAAVSTVATALAKGDAKTALTILQRQGLLTPPKPGPTDPSMVARLDRHRRAKANLELTMDECGIPNELFAPEPPAQDMAALGDPNDVDPNDIDLNGLDLGRLDGDPLPPAPGLPRRLPGPRR